MILINLASGGGGGGGGGFQRKPANSAPPMSQGMKKTMKLLKGMRR